MRTSKIIKMTFCTLLLSISTALKSWAGYFELFASDATIQTKSVSLQWRNEQDSHTMIAQAFISSPKGVEKYRVFHTLVDSQNAISFYNLHNPEVVISLNKADLCDLIIFTNTVNQVVQSYIIFLSTESGEESVNHWIINSESHPTFLYVVHPSANQVREHNHYQSMKRVIYLRDNKPFKKKKTLIIKYGTQSMIGMQCNQYAIGTKVENPQRQRQNLLRRAVDPCIHCWHHQLPYSSYGQH